MDHSTSIPPVYQTESDLLLPRNGHFQVSVCLATFKRPAALERCLRALSNQTRPAEEIVISDAGKDSRTKQAIDQFRMQYSGGPVIHVQTNRKALPWQRWWAFQHSRGDVILFLDDDIELSPDALQYLINRFEKYNGQAAGIGFGHTEVFNGNEIPGRMKFKEWWLGISALPCGTISRGGITASNLSTQSVNEVEWLGGARMAYPRSVLDRIGPLEHLYRLYDQRIGKCEDGVLSYQAGRFGKLILLTGPYAFHPEHERATQSAYPTDGFRLGILGTWGRAHTMKWLARKPLYFLIDWIKVALLEILRSISQIGTQPLKLNSWKRLMGAFLGTGRTILFFQSIPPRPCKE